MNLIDYKIAYVPYIDHCISNDYDIEYLAEVSESAMYAYEMALQTGSFDYDEMVALEAKANETPQSWWTNVRNTLNKFFQAVQDVVGRVIRSIRMKIVQDEAADLRNKAQRLNAAKVAGAGAGIAAALSVTAIAYKELKDTVNLKNIVSTIITKIRDIATASGEKLGIALQAALAVADKAFGSNSDKQQPTKEADVGDAMNAAADKIEQLDINELKTFADNVGAGVQTLVSAMNTISGLLNQVVNERNSEKLRAFQRGTSNLFDWALKKVRTPTKILRDIVTKIEKATAGAEAEAENKESDQNLNNQNSDQNSEKKE